MRAKLMMVLMLTLLMVVGVVQVVRVNPGSEVVVEWEGEGKGSAEGWIARSPQFISAHQSIK